MHFKVTPDKPRKLSRCGATVAPSQDNRWRGVPAKVQRVNSLRRHEAQMRAR